MHHINSYSLIEHAVTNKIMIVILESILHLEYILHSHHYLDPPSNIIIIWLGSPNPALILSAPLMLILTVTYCSVILHWLMMILSYSYSYTHCIYLQ